MPEMSLKEEKVLDFLISEWLKWEERAHSDKFLGVERAQATTAPPMATVCYIAAHNYYVYQIVRKGR